MRRGGVRAAAVGHAAIGLLAIAAPVLACSALSTITVENRQARDLRVDAQDYGDLGLARGCSVFTGSTYIPSLLEEKTWTYRRVRVRFRDESGQPVAEAEVAPEPQGGLGGGYRLRVAVPERQPGECPEMTGAAPRSPTPPPLVPTPARPAP
jgi:hypothetical protein